MNFHHYFWLFFCWFFNAACCSFFKIRRSLFCFLFVILAFYLANIHAVNDCCAYVAVHLNSDRCSFFFLFLSASWCNSLSKFLPVTSIFYVRFFSFCWGIFIPFLAQFFLVFCSQEGGYLEGFLACFWLYLGNLGSGILATALPPHFLVFWPSWAWACWGDCLDLGFLR